VKEIQAPWRGRAYRDAMSSLRRIESESMACLGCGLELSRCSAFIRDAGSGNGLRAHVRAAHTRPVGGAASFARRVPDP
jgi:hypothetical protein